MLSERVVIIGGLSISLLGILGLYCVLSLSQLPVAELTVVDKGHEGDAVRVVGEIEGVRHVKNDTITLLTISQQVSRKAVVFDFVNLSQGMRLELEGEVAMYEGEPELIVENLVTR